MLAYPTAIQQLSIRIFALSAMHAAQYWSRIWTIYPAQSVELESSKNQADLWRKQEVTFKGISILIFLSELKLRFLGVATYHLVAVIK
jgi:hypothetical protein